MSDEQPYRSEFRVEVVRLGPIDRHPNADTLGITQVHGGYPVITKLGGFKEGEKVVYVPVDAMVPTEREEFSFLAAKAKAKIGEEPRHRVRAARLRGIFSMGLLVPAQPGWEVGQDVAGALGVTKYEPPEEGATTGGEAEKDPGVAPVFDLAALRRYGDALQAGEEVVVTEKLHGTNARFVHHNGRLFCGSHRRYWKDTEKNVWWRIAHKYGLDAKLTEVPEVAVFGEVYGAVQNMRYGAKGDEVRLAVFAAMDTTKQRFLDWDEVVALCARLDLPMVPVLYRGPFDRAKIEELSDGPSTVPGANHIREGAVVVPIVERCDPFKCGRVALKLHGATYMLQK